MRPRGLIGAVMGMARPPRPPSEREAVVAAGKMLSCPSSRAKAAWIAKRVAEEAVAFLDMPFEHMLCDPEGLFNPSPVATLARDPEIGTVDLIARRRIERFEARGCRQISQAEWEMETSAITAAVASILTERYRRFL